MWFHCLLCAVFLGPCPGIRPGPANLTNLTPLFRNSRKLPAARERCRGSSSPWECGNVGEAQPDRGFLASWAAAKSGPGSTAAKGSPHKEHPAPEQSWTRPMPCAPPAAISSLFSYSRELPKLAQSSAVLPLFPSTPQLTDTRPWGQEKPTGGEDAGSGPYLGHGEQDQRRVPVPVTSPPGEGEQQQVPDFSHRFYLVMSSPHQQARTGVMVHEYISGVVTQTEICTAFVQRKKENESNNKIDISSQTFFLSFFFFLSY